MARAVTDIRSLARSHTALCIRTLAGIVRQKSAPPAARVVAANSLLDRGWGKPDQPHVAQDGGPLQIIIRQIIDINGEIKDEPLTIEHERAK